MIRYVKRRAICDQSSLLYYTGPPTNEMCHFVKFLAVIGDDNIDDFYRNRNIGIDKHKVEHVRQCYRWLAPAAEKIVIQTACAVVAADFRLFTKVAE